MPSRASSPPSRTAVSRVAGSLPKRAPQNTQREAGFGTDTATSFYSRSDVFPDRGDMVSFRVERARRQGWSVVAPLGGGCHALFFGWSEGGGWYLPPLC